MKEIFVLIDKEGDVICAFNNEQEANEDAEEQNCRVAKIWLNE